MAEFLWSESPRYGSCLICGTSANDSGFIDMIGDTVVRNDAGEIAGVVDIIICASCVLQAARFVGGALPSEVDALVLERENLREELLVAKNSLEASEQRFAQVISLDTEDLRVLSEMKKNADSPVDTPGP